MPISLAVDIGGTFTDLIAYDVESGRLAHAKCLSTPSEFSKGVMDAIGKAQVDLREVSGLMHGCTVAINTAIERTGALTALVVTRGTRDVYQIGRGNRPESYNIFFQRAEPLAPPSLTFEVDQRTLATGETLVPFDEAQAGGVVQRIGKSGAEAVAVCFLHSYENPADEERMAAMLAALPTPVFVTASHEISRRYGEYERMSTTVLNAYVGPRTSRYIASLEDRLGAAGFRGKLLIMQSNGGLMSAETAKRVPVTMMESGPVGGVIAAAKVGSALGLDNTIAFDMGGTTAKASLIHGCEPSIAEGYFIGGYASGHPAMLPVVDIVEVGTGGGSIAWLDEVGALKVGPQSAGAAPGPVSYGLGGTRPTVTDANLVLGRIGGESFLGGEMRLDHAKAAAALEVLGRPLGLDAVATALSVVEIAIAKMSLAVRGVSVERGFDPRDFALVGMGGGGPVHALAIARQLHIPKVVIPVFPSHFSALGMLMSDLRHDYVRTHLVLLAKLDFSAALRILQEMIDEGRRALGGEGSDARDLAFQPFLDLRYEGQEFYIKVPVSTEEFARGDAEAIRKRFDDIHDRNFGHAAPEEPLEVVNVRVTARGKRGSIRLPTVSGRRKPEPVGNREVFLREDGRPTRCPVYHRGQLGPGAAVTGPALIEEYGSTTVLFEGDKAAVAPTGEIIVTTGADA